MTLFSELKRRNVLRVAAMYIAVSWLLIQVTETLFPLFGLSDAAIRTVVIVLAIGFVPAVVAAWAFELTPEGVMRDGDVDHASTTMQAMGKRLDRLIMVALALALGYFALDKFMLDPARDLAREQAIAEAAKEEGRAEAVRESRDSGRPVLAVLPFAAVGGGDDSVFFAAGVHDDLLTKLAQLPSILVISRTSVLEYRDTETNIRDIGEELGADVILEGGVQSAGNRIRINAQLIDAQTDEHLWAKTFDKELTPSNIFDVQTEIALAITDAMHRTLSKPVEASLALIPTKNMAAYRAYHEALTLRDSVRGATQTEEAYRALLRRAVELDPSFTRPLTELVGSLALSIFGSEDVELMAQADHALGSIEALAPESADFLIAQAYYAYYIIKDYELAHAIASMAQEMKPSDARLAEMKSWIERRQGDYDAVIESTRLARTLDPRNPKWIRYIVRFLVFTHRYDEAWAEIEENGLQDPYLATERAFLSVREHKDLGRLATDIEALAQEFPDDVSADDLWWVRILNREYAVAKKLLDAMPEPVEENGRSALGVPDRQLNELVTLWFLEEREQLDELLSEARANYDDRSAEGWIMRSRATLGAAMLTALDGDTEETKRLIRRWNRTGAKDWPERANYRDFTCQVLGIAGAADATVACIRTGLSEPSQVTPYLEPYLPFYDSIRDEPTFVELLTELAD